MSKRPDSLKLVYWDSCVFLSMIEGDAERMDGIHSVLDEMKQGRIKIYTSVLSIAEVTFVKTEREKNALDKAVEERIAALWQPGSPFVLVDVFREIVIDSQKLVRDSLKHGMTIKPPDAIHFATARRVGCSDFHTFDHFKDNEAALSKLFKVKIGYPSLPGRLPFGAKPKAKSPPSKPGKPKS